jgi:hypothetical protein
LRVFNEMTRDLSPTDREKARRIALGLDGKTSSAAISYKIVTDKDGRPQIVAVDPREVGAQIVGSGETYGTGVEPAPVPMPAPTTGAGASVLSDASAPFYSSVESAIKPLGGIIGSTTGGHHNTGSLHYSGNAVDIPMGASASAEAKANADRMKAELEAQGYIVRDERTRPAGQAVWGGPHLHVERPQSVAQAGSRGNPFVGQSPAEKAAAEAQAKAQVEMQYAPRIEAAKTGASIDATNARAGASAATAGAIEGAKTTAQKAAERQQEGVGNLPTAEANADQMLALINKAIKHPGRAAATGLSSWNPLNKIPGTDARDFNVLQDQIKGRTFLEAFNSLKGGGQITENEGKKAEAAIARLDTSQSETEYLQALRDLQGVVNNARMRERSKAGARPTMPKRDQFAGFKVLD